MRISDWSSDVCSSDLRDCQRRNHTEPCQRGERDDGGLGNHPLIGTAQFGLVMLDPCQGLHGDGSEWSNRSVGDHVDRSEEHTSELQSLMRISYAVFCLKKKNTHKPRIQVEQTT